MIVLEMIFSVLLMFLFPVFMIFGVFILCWVAKWLWIVCGVCTGNKEVIQEFDCREKEPWSFDKMVEKMLMPDDRYDRHRHDDLPTQRFHVSWRDDDNYKHQKEAEDVQRTRH
jgi:hypothetical protein